MNDKGHKDWYITGFIVGLRKVPQKTAEERTAETTAKATYNALMVRLAKKG